MKCAVCSVENDKKYKCPQCSSPYCSVACFKKHKEECAPQPKIADQQDTIQTITSEAKSDQLSLEFKRLTAEQLQRLGESQEISEFIEKHPNIKGLLLQIQSEQDVELKDKMYKEAEENNEEFGEFTKLVFRILQVANSNI